MKRICSLRTPVYARVNLPINTSQDARGGDSLVLCQITYFPRHIHRMARSDSNTLSPLDGKERVPLNNDQVKVSFGNLLQSNRMGILSASFTEARPK